MFHSKAQNHYKPSTKSLNPDFHDKIKILNQFSFAEPHVNRISIFIPGKLLFFV